MLMRPKIIALTAALVAGTAIAGSAQAQWVYVPSDAPRNYVYQTDRGYVTTERRIYPRVAPRSSGDIYVAADATFNDNCTYHRERGLFGGWYETRHCPD